MKKSFFIFLFAVVSFVSNSCSIDNNEPNFNFLPLQIVSADLPEFFTLNETITIQVTYVQPDDCTSFAGFDIVDQDTTARDVVVFGTKRTDQQDCTENNTEQTTSFDFTVNYPDPYTFRFWQGENENGEQQYLVIEVPVN